MIPERVHGGRLTNGGSTCPCRERGFCDDRSIERNRGPAAAGAKREVENAPTGVEARRSAQIRTRNGPAPVPASKETPVIRAPREGAASVRLSIPSSDARPASPSRTQYDL